MKDEKEKQVDKPKMLKSEKLALLRAIGFDTKSTFWQKASEKVIDKTIKFFGA